MKLVTALAAGFVIMAVAASCAAGVAWQQSKAAAGACAVRIVAAAAAEYAEGCVDSGGGARLDITVPGCAAAITFGPAGADGPGECDGSYLIQYADGSKETYLVGLPLGSGGPPCRGGPVVLYPGSYSVRIRLETVDDRPMALIYAEAA